MLAFFSRLLLVMNLLQNWRIGDIYVDYEFWVNIVVVTLHMLDNIKVLQSYEVHLKTKCYTLMWDPTITDFAVVVTIIDSLPRIGIYFHEIYNMALRRDSF